MSSRNDAIVRHDLTVKTALVWIGSSNALSWPVIIWVAFWPLITGATGEPLPGFEMPINIHVYDLLNGVIPAIILVAFRWLFKANKPSGYTSSTSRNFAAQLIAAVLGLGLTLAIVASFGTVPASYFVSAPIGMLSTWGQICAFTIITIAVIELRAATKKLAVKTQRLNLLRANLETRVVDQREALQLEVEARVGEPVEVLRGQLDELQESASQRESAAKLASRIADTIDNVVRPLSLEIANSVTEDTRAEVRSLKQVERQMVKLPLKKRMGLPVRLNSVFNAPFTAIFLLVFIVPTYGYLFGPLAMLQVALPAAIFSTLLIWLAGRVSKNVPTTYFVAMLSVPLGAGIAAVPFATLNRLVLTNNDLALLDFVAFGSCLVFAFVFIGSLLYQAAYQILDRVQEANNELRKLVGFLQNEFLINRRKLAQVVHGKVQARLQAASLRLKQADKITDELIAAIQEDLNATVLDTAETSLDAQSVESLLSEMTDHWSGICDLTFSFGGGVCTLVNANSTLKAAVVEVVREAVNNAVKHGEADEADINITSSAPDSVSIEVRNRIYSKLETAESKTRGYGSQLLDQITDSWSISFEDDDAIFEATISIVGTSL